MKIQPTVALVAATLVAVCTSACTTDDTTKPDVRVADSAKPTTSSSANTDTAEHSALRAYEEMWKAFTDAATNGNGEARGLGEFATGTALATLSRSLKTDHRGGIVTKGEPTHAVRILSVEPAVNPIKVILADCSDSSKALKYRASTDQLVNDVPGGRRLINGIVERQSDGSWRVSDFGVQEVGSC